jgi:hypothetical protein
MSSTIAGLAQAGGLEAAFEALVLTLDRLAIDHHGETFLEGERGDIGLVRYERGHRSRVKNTISKRFCGVFALAFCASADPGCIHESLLAASLGSKRLHLRGHPQACGAMAMRSLWSPDRPCARVKDRPDRDGLALRFEQLVVGPGGFEPPNRPL